MWIHNLGSYLFDAACGCPGIVGRMLRHLVYGFFAVVLFLSRRRVPFSWRFALREPSSPW